MKIFDLILEIIGFYLTTFMFIGLLIIWDSHGKAIMLDGGISIFSLLGVIYFSRMWNTTENSKNPN